MFKKIIFGLSLFVTLGFGATLDDAYNAYEKGDFKTALPIFEDLALKGDTDAQFYIGVMYRDGKGVKKEIGRANV